MVRPDSLQLWNALHGIICVYKPAEISVKSLRTRLISKLCKDLSELDVKLRYPERDSESLSISDGSVTSSLVKNYPQEIVLFKDKVPDLRFHPLVVGPRYLDEDLIVSWSNYLGWNTSGVLLFGLRKGTKIAKFIRENRSTRAYRISGVFGKATDNGFKSGKVVERSTWKYIKQRDIDLLLSSMQASHQKKMYELCGVDMQSQLAYELAVKGPIRPSNSKVPIFYGLKCIDYEGPNFTLEVQCINEDENYLTNIIHEIGVKLHSTAYTSAIKCIRHSCFNIEHALLPKHFNLENITQNIDLCNRLLQENEDIVKQDRIALR